MASPPPPRPIRGPAAAAWYLRFSRDPIRCLLRARREQGELTVLGPPVPGLPRPRLYVLALGPAWNQRVLGDPATFRHTGQTLPGPRGSAQRRLRYGLTRSRGEAHARQREWLLPAFQRPVVEAACPRMVALVEGVLDGWLPGRRIDARAEMRKLMLRLSSEILFGREDPERSYRLGELIGHWFTRNFSPAVWLALVDLPGTPYHRLLRHAEALERDIRAMIEEKRAGAARGSDLLSRLIRAHEAGEAWMSDRDLVGQATILFAASYETTANALTWTLFLLAQHPAVAAELCEEIRGALRGGPPSREALAAMPLLEAVLKESLRILPPVPYAVRAVDSRAGAELGPLRLSRGDRVLCSHYVTHHLPELYAEPERFRPQRWFEIRRGPYEYLPFSAGPRLCLGVSFASLALKVALAMILQRFRLSVLPGSRIDRSVRVTMAPARGLPMSVHPPDGRFAAAPVRGNVTEMVSLG